MDYIYISLTPFTISGVGEVYTTTLPRRESQSLDAWAMRERGTVCGGEMVSKSTRRKEARKAASINHTGASRDECQGEACELEVYCSYREDGQRILTARKRRVGRKRQLCLRKTPPPQGIRVEASTGPGTECGGAWANSE